MMWSTSNRVVHTISRQYFGYHYVWCSPAFDASALGRYSLSSQQPPSSDPVSIYREQHAAVVRRDEHNAKVASQKATLKGVALKLSASGTISEYEFEEIVTFVDRTTIDDWVPVIYAIPFAPIAAKVLAVPRSERASAAPEYVVPNLLDSEFDVIEPMICR